MAKVIKKSNALRRKHARYLTVTVISYLVSLMCLVAFVVKSAVDIHTGTLSPLAAALLLTGFFLFGGIGGWMINKTKSIGAGFRGEDMTAEIVAGLPQGYFGFQNIEITVDGKTSEIDLAVVGPTGLFVIETKNLNGYISGDIRNARWVQCKTGRGGTPYSRYFYSPVKQVGTHVYRLARYLKSNGIKVHIDSVVYFSNPGSEVSVSGTDGSCPVFSAADNGRYKLTYYITRRPETLSDDNIRKICAVLNR